MDESTWIKLIALFILLLLSAFFSSAETALTTVNRYRIQALIEEGNKRAIVVLKVIDDSGKMLSAILIGNNIVNISASALATILAQELFGSYAVSLATGILTVLVLIFGEITPKTMATLKAEKFSLIYSKIIYSLMILLTPVIFIINLLANGVMRLLGINPKQVGNSITEGELRTLVNVSHEEGVIESDERKMINNVFDFGDTVVKDIMIPRIDMTMVDVSITYPELLEIFKKERYTRIPIYDQNSDDIIGIINMKDLLLYHETDVFNARDYLRKAYFTYESKNLSDLMVEMKKSSVNIVIVLDEYGVTAGLLTLEDLLEEIVGDIKDEYDTDEDASFIQVNENEYLISGTRNLEDVNDLLNVHFTSDDYDSLGGIIMEHLDKLPAVGDTVTIDHMRLTVLSLEKKRIKQVRALRIPEELPTEEE